MANKVVKHTRAERKALRAKKRKTGPSAVRRAAKRHEVLQTLECGCKQTRVRMETCAAHSPISIEVDATEPVIVVAAMLDEHGAER